MGQWPEPSIRTNHSSSTGRRIGFLRLVVSHGDGQHSSPTFLVFAQTTSKYRGDKWDTFFDQLPWALVNHINGNAMYNLSHPLLEVIVRQLENEAGTVANSIPYDYRIAQMIEEVQTGMVPSFFADDRGIPHRLPRHFIHSMSKFDLDALIRETSVIGNYASTHMVPSYLTQHEVVVHGANMLASSSILDGSCGHNRYHNGSSTNFGVLRQCTCCISRWKSRFG
mmetsp:Transcript_61832/g.170980  ORF Transcript_61832/g.170980 Transcript_61832/m.170980 type:complete len:224 (-) Transcript_61832:215-886(-)